MEIQPALAIWTVVVFVGLLWVLKRFAWGPLSQALHQREEHLEHCLLQTEKARNESEQLLAEHRRLMAQADDRIRALLDKAQKDAQASADEIIKTAQAEAEAARDRAQREISTARDQALAEIWSQTANVAVSVAGRVLSRELDENEHRRLLDLAIKELPSLTPSTNGHGGAHA
jgi:F-type H+-transporting ATPase subunit b